MGYFPYGSKMPNFGDTVNSLSDSAVNPELNSAAYLV